MKRSALICAVLLCSTALSYAATPDALWQDYQKHPGVVSTTPTKPVQTPAPHVTVEAHDGSISEPTTPEQAQAEAQVHEADIAKVDKNEQNAATETAVQETAVTDKPAIEQGDSSVFSETPVNTNVSTAPVIGNKPVSPANKPKPKPKLNLVGKPPLPKQFMRTPQAGDFKNINCVKGGYSIALPNAFGTAPLAALPQAEGAMLVRTASDEQMCAVTMLDAADTLSYNATQPLPVYENKKIYWTWKHDATLTWICTLSSHNDYHGDKMLLEAHSQQNGKTYQLLFVMPKARFTDLLPQAIYALNSFKLNS